MQPLPQAAHQRHAGARRVTVSARLSPTDAEAIDRLAEQRGITRSHLVSLVVAEWVRSEAAAS